jgi:hypothetical protein
MDIVEGPVPSKMKEETTNNSVRAIEVGALSTLGTSACTNWKKDDGNTPGPTGFLSGSRSSELKEEAAGAIAE